MYKYAGQDSKKLGITSPISIRYGREPNIENRWQEIVAIQDTAERHAKVDELLAQMEQNANENSFYSTDEPITIKGTENIIVFDDKSLYYLYFDNLKVLTDKRTLDNVTISDNALINQAIQLTTQDYFGDFDKITKIIKKKVDTYPLEEQATALSQELQNLRLSKTLVSDDLEPASIANERGQCCSMCVERAVTTHNLWLLSGKTSYCIYTAPAECNFENESSVTSGDSHYYNIVEITEGVFRMYDLSLFNVCAMEGNPIQDMIDGKPIVIEGTPNNKITMGKTLYSGVTTRGVYANYPEQQKEQQTAEDKDSTEDPVQ